MSRHYIATTTAPAPYWENWWDKVGIVQKNGQDCFLLRSKRTGSDARVDADVLEGRARSGCYWADAREQADD